MIEIPAQYYMDIVWVRILLVCIALCVLYNIYRLHFIAPEKPLEQEDIESVTQSADKQVVKEENAEPIPEYFMPTITAIINLFKLRGVSAKFTEAVDGPMVSYFTFKVPNDVKTSVLDSGDMAADMSRAIGRGASIDPFIEQMGKIRVCVENPNPKPVLWRDSIREPKAGEGYVQMPVGIDPYGELLFGDATDYSNLLIAGTRGSGKSTWMQGAINYMMRYYTPKNVRFCMFDLKEGMELARYKHIPHLSAPIVDGLMGSVGLLKQVQKEMQRRARILRDHDCTKIQELWDIKGVGAMPLLIVVIDEISTLTRIDSGAGLKVLNDKKKTCTHMLLDIAEKGRAPGVYLWVCTQHPLNEVIPSGIKNNMSKVAFRCETEMQSKVIRDDTLAADLKGAGHGIIDKPEGGYRYMSTLFINRQDYDTTLRMIDERVTCEAELPMSAWEWRAHHDLVADEVTQMDEIPIAPAIEIENNVFVEERKPYDVKVANDKRYKYAVNYVKLCMRTGSNPTTSELNAYLKQNFGKGWKAECLGVALRQIPEYDLNEEEVA